MIVREGAWFARLNVPPLHCLLSFALWEYELLEEAFEIGREVFRREAVMRLHGEHRYSRQSLSELAEVQVPSDAPVSLNLCDEISRLDGPKLEESLHFLGVLLGVRGVEEPVQLELVHQFGVNVDLLKEQDELLRGKGQEGVREEELRS